MPRRDVKSPRPPAAYRDFIDTYPGLGGAWDTISDEGLKGPLDARACRLVKLAVAMGAMREGAVRAGARKAKAAGIEKAAIEQLVPLAAATIGLPGAVACFTWIRSALEKQKRK